MFLLISCYAADLVFGDPEWFPHPVRGMGKLISLLEKRLNVKSAILAGRLRGIMLTFIVVGISVLLAYFFIGFSKKLNLVLGNLAWIYLGYTTLAIKDLQVKVKAVSKGLRENKISEARKELSKIVGRDTQNLNKDRITRAAIESVAENTNDGIIAPLFYLILGGPVLALAYKSINTLDSIVGHKYERYLHIGWFSAKADDIANFVPARISGFLISISSLISRKMVRQAHHPSNHPERSRRGFKNSFKTMLQDGRKHPSPNSGISEAAMAGALGIRLGGPSTYHGRLSNKPYIGEDKEAVEPLLINEALSISLITSILMLLIGVLVKWSI